LGVLGGGQLGRMFVHAAQAHGFRVAVLEPDVHSPAAAAADEHIAAAYTDPAALSQLQDRCHAVTTEFENVPAAALQSLADAGLMVSPRAAAVRVCQHRAREKQCFIDAGVPCAPHAVIRTPADLAAPGLSALLPGILKTATLGYDGKGQAVVETPEELARAWAAMGQVECVLEHKLPLAFEISAIVARGHDGQVVHLPVQHNLHRQGVLAVTQVPAPGVAPETAQQALDCAARLAAAHGPCGVAQPTPRPGPATLD
jgi:5-(carboxyamino)imidazole ribonucleotide synthase